jgi:hypothetical protein
MKHIRAGASLSGSSGVLFRSCPVTRVPSGRCLALWHLSVSASSGLKPFILLVLLQIDSVELVFLRRATTVIIPTMYFAAWGTLGPDPVDLALKSWKILCTERGQVFPCSSAVPGISWSL